MGFFFCKFHLFPLFILSFLCFACFSSSLSTVSISETSNLTIVCALVHTNGGLQPSPLNCSSFPVHGIQTPFNPNYLFSGIVSGDGFVCGLRPLFSPSNVSVMHCWRFSSNGSFLDLKRIYKGPALNQLEAGNTHICGLNDTNGLECWQWPGFNQTGGVQFFSEIAVGEGFVCGLTEDQKAIRFIGNFAGITGREIRGNYKKIAAGFKHACAINSDDGLECWGNGMGDRDLPQGQFKELALGLNRSCALRTNGTVVCWGMDSFRLPQELETLDFITIKAKTNVFCGVSTSNYSLFCWGHRNFDQNHMVFSEVFPGPCRNVCQCGSLQGSGLLCSTGGSICQACPVAAIPSAPPPQPESRSSNSGLNGRLIAFLVVGCVGSSVFLLHVGFFVFRYCKDRGCRVHDSGRLDETGAPANGGSGSNQTPQGPPAVLEKRLSQLTSMGTMGRLEEFSFEALVQATNNFSDDHKIGTGSFGSVYHGTLDDGREVAIKRAEITSSSSYVIGPRRQEDKDDAFVNELEYLSRVHHKNLVQLLGFCEDSNERILVYEYMNNGTLYDHLHKFENSLSMSWAIRLKIALDTARGIQYLHEYAVPQIIHRDIKSANILLDTNWTAKVSDFGLSLMGPGDDESHLSLRAAGTVGYMDPEYYRLQQLTTKSDVYSFGIVLLELLSGYRAIHRNENGAHRNVVDFLVPYVLRDEIHRVLDPRVPPPTPFEIEAVAYVGYLAADCVRLEGRDRPSMTEIVNSLEKALTACLIPHDFSRSTTQSSTERTNFVQ
ncbi:Serine/threonine-protein kinase-like protein CCR4 [Hibiscus syriacus]|uniref:non-specific serine/threonine protein kinase n=1 Tax=Hibiscus syriacus TaxID=106335 RepID=A0A6A3B201_HIBSY|nr:serine/threonine-protein kinase-like protein CCR4 [Hibiscus syriacus]KAE8709908.1 Serine/threonine-protein kinase-like protein CCR4 [Hibiscus syriacus]